MKGVAAEWFVSVNWTSVAKKKVVKRPAEEAKAEKRRRALFSGPPSTAIGWPREGDGNPAGGASAGTDQWEAPQRMGLST